MSLAVAIVSFQTREVLEPCLRSVVADGPAEVVVVDNGSTDGSIELVREHFPSVTLIVNEVNRGYGAAANQAVRASSAPAVLLLNSDTELWPGTLAAIARHLGDHPGAAVVAPRLADPDGALQRSALAYPSVADMLVGESGLHALIARVPLLRERLLRTWSHDAARPVPWARGAALALRRDAFDAVGGFDEAFFMYFEEVDLSRRLAARGWETHFTPAATVVHVRSVSTDKYAPAMRRQWLVSFRRYLRRHESRRRTAVLLGLLRAITRARVARDGLRARRAGDPARRARLLEARTATAALLAERELWSP